jgi:putative ABC transport system ATP-binding protein
VPPSEATATCTGLVQIYRVDSGEVHALRGIDASFSAGSVTAVVGPSGSGKSTLLRMLALAERPTAGALTIAGVDVMTASTRRIRDLRRRSVAVVLQRPTHNLYPHLTVREHLQLGARRRHAERGEVDAAIEAVGLTARRRSVPALLSGGEQQRLAVAMASIGRPALVLADEPTAELDATNADAVIELLHRSAAAGATVVVNTHDPAVAARADRVLALHHGTLHSERHLGGTTVAVIDAIGRVQLSPEMLLAFPDLRAELHVESDGSVVVRPIGRTSDGRPEEDPA